MYMQDKMQILMLLELENTQDLRFRKTYKINESKK